MNPKSSKQHCRIVLTGGPGAGKTTAALLLNREIGDRIIVIPEAATMLFSGGFPRYDSTFAIKSTQRAIYHVQRNIEDVQSFTHPNRLLLCDRGTLDGAIYWPDGSEDFFSALETSAEAELLRYDAVVFLETAAVGDIDIEGNNPVRKESRKEAIKIDRRLKELWAQHPNFHFIPHEKSFMKKIIKAQNCLVSFLNKFEK